MRENPQPAVQPLNAPAQATNPAAQATAGAAPNNHFGAGQRVWHIHWGLGVVLQDTTPWSPIARVRMGAGGLPAGCLRDNLIPATCDISFSLFHS